MAVPDVQELRGGKTRTGILANFRVGSSALLPKHQDWLDNVAAHLLTKGLVRWLGLYGHASRTGSDEVNMEVARARVLAVRQRLVEKGVSPSQINEDTVMGERAWKHHGFPDDTENPEHRAVHVVLSL